MTRIRGEAGWPPLAAPIGQILGSQALLERALRPALRDGARRVPAAGGRALRDAAGADRPVRCGGPSSLLSDAAPALAEDPPSAEDVREAAEGLAASEEDLVLLAMFGEEAETMLQTIRQRHSRESSLLAGDVDATRAERIRELVRIVQESGVGEIEIEDEGMRVSVRRAEEAATPPPTAFAALTETDVPVLETPANGAVVVESPMVGVFFRGPEPGAPPFVEVGDVVASGQTLCLLEAMKLFNELKAEIDGRVTAIHVDNGQPVEFGTPLFELEPVAGPPVL